MNCPSVSIVFCFTCMIFGRPFVKQFALCYRSVVCRSVTLVYCGQTVGWIKMKLDMEEGVGHIVLDGDPAPPPQRGTAPNFRPSPLWPNGWLIKMPLGTEVGLGQGHIVLDGDPASASSKKAQPQFSAHVCCGQMAGLINMPLGTEVGRAQATLC